MNGFVGTVFLTCPHCGFKNRMPVEAEELNRANMTTCDLEEGGCDTPFAWKPTVEISAAIFKLEEVK